MPRKRKANPKWNVTVLTAAAFALALAGCDSVATGPAGGDDDGSSVSFSEQISSSELNRRLDSRARRVELKLFADRLVARRVEVERDRELGDDEKIESPVVDLLASGDGGRLTLALGGLEVEFDGDTRFEDETDGEGRLTRDEFVDRVRTALDEGRRPVVGAKRTPPAEPQAPDDATFVADEIQLQEPDDDREIEINVDGDNLEENASPPPEAWITVLGLRIEIRAGATEIRDRRERDDPDDVDFEDLVASVDVEAGAFTLEDGTRVRIVEGTEIEKSDRDDPKHPASLQEVADALASGRAVEADGEGILESRDPRTLVAVEVEFEAEEDLDGGDEESDDE